jgi:HPt (histidine-containing phosphotransfer) domain-containing protein
VTDYVNSPASPAAAPRAGAPPAIDHVHLAEMTLGDRGLQREVLELFDRQAELLLARMRKAEPPGVASLAHTLCGSARSIGAWRVAAAAEALERSAAEHRERPRLAHLLEAVAEARGAIAGLTDLRGPA